MKYGKVDSRIIIVSVFLIQLAACSIPRGGAGESLFASWDKQSNSAEQQTLVFIENSNYILESGFRTETGSFTTAVDTLILRPGGKESRMSKYLFEIHEETLVLRFPSLFGRDISGKTLEGMWKRRKE